MRKAAGPARAPRPAPEDAARRPGCVAAGVRHRLTIHGFRRTFNNLVRRVAEGVVVRSMTGHATIEMTDHDSHVDVREKQAAVAGVVALVARAGSTQRFVGTSLDREVLDASRG